MDELKLKLSTKFMKGIVAKLLAKALRSKFGYEIDIQLNAIEVKAVDGKMQIHIDADAEMETEEFVKILKSNGLD